MNIIEAKILALACKFKLVLEQTRKEVHKLRCEAYSDQAITRLERVSEKLKMLEVLEEIGLGEIIE